MPKIPSEFRRPTTVAQRYSAKNTMPVKHINGTKAADWEVRQLSQNNMDTISRLNNKNNDIKKATKNTELPVLPITTDVLSNMPPCKISNLRITSQACPSDSPPPEGLDSPTSIVSDESNSFKDNLHSNKAMTSIEDPTLTPNKSPDMFSRISLPPTPSDSARDEDEEEDSTRDSSESNSKCSISPILSQPTTIRFPAEEPQKKRGSGVDSGFCLWEGCTFNFETNLGLLEHLQVAHIHTQTGCDNFVCNWKGCKVQGKTSCSRRWLERHVTSHGGNKPFVCIVESCGMRYSSQTALERHVNGHFTPSASGSSASSRKSNDSTGKLVRRSGKKVRYRRQPWSSRTFDYFDPGVMEHLQHRLLDLDKIRTQGHLVETPGNSMLLTSQILARRVETDGKTRILLRWYPENIEPDEWVLESEVSKTKHVNIRKVANTRPDELNEALYQVLNGGKPPVERVKQRRKPIKTT